LESLERIDQIVVVVVLQLANVTQPDLRTTLVISNQVNANAKEITAQENATNVTMDSTTIQVVRVSSKPICRVKLKFRMQYFDANMAMLKRSTNFENKEDEYNQ